MSDDDTVELDREAYEEFMSILDGVLDGIYGYGYAEEVRQLDDLREEMEQQDDGKGLKARGHISFDHSTEEAFEDLVLDTLEMSDFIEVEESITGEQVIYEVYDE